MTAVTQAGRVPGDVHAKALAINLDPSIYGSIAEIGAGQEVARWFLRVSGASGTLARTHSAYDKTFSDFTYGRARATCPRNGCRPCSTGSRGSSSSSSA